MPYLPPFTRYVVRLPNAEVIQNVRGYDGKMADIWSAGEHCRRRRHCRRRGYVCSAAAVGVAAAAAALLLQVHLYCRQS